MLYHMESTTSSHLLLLVYISVNMILLLSFTQCNYYNYLTRLMLDTTSNTGQAMGIA